MKITNLAKGINQFTEDFGFWRKFVSMVPMKRKNGLRI